MLIFLKLAACKSKGHSNCSFLPRFLSICEVLVVKILGKHNKLSLSTMLYLSIVIYFDNLFHQSIVW